MEAKNPFEAMEVISVYGDGQAVEDGMLVAIGAKDRVTRACFEWLAAKAPSGSRPPSRWPVEMMGWFKGKTRDAKAAALAGGLIGTHGRRAREVYEQNLGGGIFVTYALVGHGELLSLEAPLLEPSAKESDELGRRLWLIPNELGGLTLMFPEDY